MGRTASAASTAVSAMSRGSGPLVTFALAMNMVRPATVSMLRTRGGVDAANHPDQVEEICELSLSALDPPS